MKRWVVSGMLAAVAVCGPSVWAAGAGETAYSFLKIGPDARAEAMGGAYTGLADGPGGMYYNPAALARVGSPQFMATYNNWLTDIQSGFIACALPLGARSHFGASVQYLDYGDFAARDALGNPRAGFNASDVALTAGFALPIGARSSAGLSGHFITESIDGESSSALSVDLGFLRDFGDSRTRVGLAIRNLGAQTGSMGTGPKDDLATVFAAGFTHRLQGAPVVAAADLLKPTDGDFAVAAGVEVDALRPLALRLGYNGLIGQVDTGSDKDTWAGLTFGAGFSIDRVVIDYAYGSYSELGGSHRFTLRTGL